MLVSSTDSLNSLNVSSVTLVADDQTEVNCSRLVVLRIDLQSSPCDSKEIKVSGSGQEKLVLMKIPMVLWFMLLVGGLTGVALSGLSLS